MRILIRTQAGKEVILAEMRAGQFFGELSAIDSTKRSANVTALTRAELCIMPAAVFREVIFASSTVCDRVLHLLTSRVRELNARLTEHSIFDLKHRLYFRTLGMAGPRPGKPGERSVTPPPFHHVLAARIGCRREQVTRELSTMAQEGLLEKDARRSGSFPNRKSWKRGLPRLCARTADYSPTDHSSGGGGIVISGSTS